jgi:predicted dehydrogenase
MHKQIVCDALNAGKHVLCEKLMAYSVAECKEMIALAEKKGLVLQIGHQRHYSALYRQALEYVQSGKLGDIYHIDAFWHRDTKWTRPMPATGQDVVTQFFNKAAGEVNGANTWYKLPPADAKRLKDALTSVDTDTAARLHKESMSLDWSKWGFKDFLQFRQWRLFKKYSQGLMAELGSHQLDACGILLGHKHPVDVVGNGFQVEQDFREVADHIYAQFTYPGKVTVTYSSIISNNFRNYGEMVFGTKGTLIIEAEQDLMLFESTKAGAPKPTEVKVEAPAAAAAAGKPPATTVDASSSAPADWGGGAGKAASGPASAGRGYKEEIQHFAVCVRTGDLSKEKPRCDGRQALGDAVIALKANEAIVSGQRLKFSDDEFKA